MLRHLGVDRPGGRATFGLIGTMAVLLIAEGANRIGVVDSTYLPAPSRIVGSLIDQASGALFWHSVWETMRGWALGLGLAIAIAVPSGVLIGSSEYVYRAVRPIVEFLRPIPSVALIPVAVLIFGTGMGSKVFLVAFASTWPMLIQTLYGLRAIEPTQIETAHSYRVPARRRITRIVFPSALPYLTTGLRIAVSVALVLAVTAELVTGAPGLGEGIIRAQSAGAVTPMYALIVATGLIGLLLNMVLGGIESRVLRWHPSQRRESR